MLIAALCADGPQRDRQHPPDRPRLRAHRRAPARPRRADRARRDRAASTRSLQAADNRRPMIRPIPSGTRDVLPDEMRELRAITDALRGVFERRGYGEVYTPALEYEDGRCAAADGGVAAGLPRVRRARRRARAALRHDGADRARRRRRATRRPSRRCASATSPTPTAACAPHRGQMREFLQAGIELSASPAPDGTAEALTVLCHALDAVGLAGLPRSASATPRCTRRCWRRSASTSERRERAAARARHARLRRPRARGRASSASSPSDAELLVRVPQLRGGAEVLDATPGPVADALRGLRGVHELLDGRGRRARDLRPRPRARPRLLHGRGVRGLRPGARRAARRRRALRRPARALRPPAAGGRLRARRRPAARRAGRRGAGREPLSGLTIAVPRGALFGETLDLLDAHRHRHGRGARQRPQAAVRATSASSRCARPTCRPTSRPGAADIGITGKDVLMEQSEREVYELLDLGYGALHDGARHRRRRPDPAAEALRRLGVMRVATKYPRIAARYFEDTGRQAEIVEVKGSVELAPLTGLVEAIVDLTATGTTLRENGLVVREEIAVVDRAADRQPGRPQAARRRRSTTLVETHRVRVERLDARRGPGRARRRGCGRWPRRRRVGRATRSPRSSPTVRDGGDAALRELRRALRRRRRRRCASRRRRARSARWRRSTPTCAPALEVAIANVARGRRGRAGADEREVALPAGPARHAARGARSRRAAIYVPGGRAPYPSTVVMGVVTARAAGVEEVVVCAPRRAPGDPRRLRAVRRRRGLRDGRRARGRRARLRDRDDRARRRDRRPRQPLRAGGQAPGVAATSASTASPGPSDVLVLADGGADPHAGRARPARPGRARRGHDRRRGVSDDAALARRDRRCAGRRRDGGAVAALVARRRPRRRRSRSPRRSRPSTSSSSAPRPRRWRRACAAPAACSSARASGDRVRRLRRRLEPHRCRPAAPRASPPGSARATSAGACSEVRIGAAAGALARGRRADRARPRASTLHAESMERAGECRRR